MKVKMNTFPKNIPVVIKYTRKCNAPRRNVHDNREESPAISTLCRSLALKDVHFDQFEWTSKFWYRQRNAVVSHWRFRNRSQYQRSWRTARLYFGKSEIPGKRFSQNPGDSYLLCLCVAFSWSYFYKALFPKEMLHNQASRDNYGNVVRSRRQIQRGRVSYFLIDFSFTVHSEISSARVRTSRS